MKEHFIIKSAKEYSQDARIVYPDFYDKSKISIMYESLEAMESILLNKFNDSADTLLKCVSELFSAQKESLKILYKAHFGFEEDSLQKEFRSMIDLGYRFNKPWYQIVQNTYGSEVVKHSDANFYGVYGSNRDGWNLAYWGEDMDEPWIGSMYYDEECSEMVDIGMFEI